jgi:MoxR-like ATPase
MALAHFPAGSETDVDAMVANAIKTMADAGLTYDEEAIRDMIAEALGKFTPGEAEEAEAPGVKKVTVNDGEGLKAAGAAPVKRKRRGVTSGEKYWYEPEEDTAMLDWFINGRRAGTVEGNLLIVGPSGSGKTEGVIHAAERLNVPIYIVDCPSITTIEKWVGHKEIDHDGTHFVLSEIMEYFRATKYEPGVVLLDEASRLHATFHNITYPLLDGRKRIFIPEMHDYHHLQQQVAIIATANIGCQYTRTFNMDLAFRERLGYTIERSWPPAGEEQKILSSLYPTIDAAKIKMMVDIANRTRQKWYTQDLKMPISTRTLVYAARLVRDGASVARAFELTAVTMYSQDGGEASERAIVKGIITGKGGDKA